MPLSFCFTRSKLFTFHHAPQHICVTVTTVTTISTVILNLKAARTNLLVLTYVPRSPC